jgi:hypothetical protein
MAGKWKGSSREVSQGKLMDFESMTAPGTETFNKASKSWMNLKNISPSYEALPSISETFPMLRSRKEVLNMDSVHSVSRN